MSLADLFMNANHIAAGGSAGSFQPQTANNGLLLIYGLEVFGAAATRGPLANVISLAIRNFQFPMQSSAVHTISFLNADRKFASNKQLDPMSFEVTDYVDQPVAATLQNWRHAVLDPINERVGLARNYKKMGEIILLGPNGQYDRRYQLQGLWPSDFMPGGIDYQNGDAHTINMTLQVDKFYPIQSTGWGYPHLYPLGNLNFDTAFNAVLGAAEQIF